MKTWNRQKAQIVIKDGYACKKCSNCGEVKSLEIYPRTGFYRNGDNRYDSQCKACKARGVKRYRKDNSVVVRDSMLRFVEKHPDYSGNKWNKSHPELARFAYAKSYQKHKAKRCAAVVLRRKTDIMFRLHDRLSAGIRGVLKQDKRNVKTWDMLGYTVLELKNRLESLFVGGMTWANFGKWHIDHIIPKSFFRFSSADDVEFKMCWRLENLQPLWAKDNLVKSNKMFLAS